MKRKIKLILKDKDKKKLLEIISKNEYLGQDEFDKMLGFTTENKHKKRQ